MRRRGVLTAGALLAMPRHDGGAFAQSWPARPIRLLIPYPPGGGADTLCRPYAERMRARLGQPMVVENRAGAATTIGMEAAARAGPDGYTLVANTDNVSYFPFLYARLPYDLFRDFAPVTYLASSPLVLAIHPGVPARDLGEFVALVRREPGRLTFANSSVGAPHHLAFELLAREAGMPRMLQAEYRGGGPALNDVLAGHVQVGVFTLGAVGQHFAAGTLRPLAVLGERRSASAPDIPTVAEGGFPAATTALRFVLLAPAGTPPEIVRALHAATAEAMAGLRDTLGRAGFEPVTTTPEETGALLRAERDRWAPILPGLNLRLD
jgi:tripartite-type tricarboxylate transporter receptor subunit TctC